MVKDAGSVNVSYLLVDGVDSVLVLNVRISESYQ